MKKSLLILFILTFSFVFSTLIFASQHIGTDDHGTTVTGITATGSGTDYTATATYDNEFSIADPNRTGYTFDGWTIIGTDSSVITLAGKTKSDGKFIGVKGLNNVKNLSTTQDDNINLKAAYTPIVYTISYDLDGGNLSEQKTSYTIETDSFTLPPPLKDGYNFTGWTGSNGTTPQTTVIIPKGSMGNKTYMANWEQNPLVDLTITAIDSWWGNIKYGTINEQVTAKTYKVPAGSLVRLYGKVGSKSLLLYNHVSGETSYCGTKAVPYNDGCYYNNNYTITTPGAQFVMPSTTLSLSPYGKNNGFYGVNVYSGSITLNTLSYDTTTYNISYNLDGGSLSNPGNTYTEITNTFNLPTPTKSGYGFIGWTGSNGETPQTTVTIQQGSTGDLSYTAHWAPLVDLTFTYVDGSYWGNIKYGTTNEQVAQKTYKVPAGTTVKLYGKEGSKQLYLYSNGGSFKWESTDQTSDGWVSSPSTVTGVQFNMPSSALSLYLGYRSGNRYRVGVDSGSVTLNPLE